MKVAVEGCCHGDLDAIYTAISTLEAQNGYKVDLLLICGDFQAVRNWSDLQCMAVPDKYKELKDFYKYYSGESKVPIPTIVIGGNHEASNYMHELYYGGWLAPNLYFMGHAGSIIVNGLRISGASGIFAPQDFNQGLHEKLPYDRGTMRSIYHTREFSIRRLSLLPQPHIFLSHDWPVDITAFGSSHPTPRQSREALLRIKPFFRKDITSGKLGSPPLMGLLRRLKPCWWFCAHLHVRFEAIVVHEADGNIAPAPATIAAVPAEPQRNPDEIIIDDDDDGIEGGPSATVMSQSPVVQNPDEIIMDDDDLDSGHGPSSSVAAAAAATSTPGPAKAASTSTTKFLALDKCLPRRQFLEVVDISPPSPGSDPTIPLSTYPSAVSECADPTPLLISYDPHWLAISRAFQPYLSTQSHQTPFPPTEEEALALVEKELQWVKENVPRKLQGAEADRSRTDGATEETWEITRCQEFEQTAPVETKPGNGKNMPSGTRQPPWYPNPQTKALCEMLEIDDRIGRYHSGHRLG